ncbi:AI-2E family transporter [Marinococcus sp. PL1-022]|uniref:AI-2E family transporter n=1 Tax=Marinococcus sp. PL1-022 TaxID=3095363 RepID=UPI0029C2E9B5|nr:AI-2E family transporter [Marinococcus sp. PL1-022]MDX6153916.1 AI-2E family transporter [Marinococcus sp. PL1-022]
MYQYKWFRVSLGILVVLAIAFMARQVDYIFQPLFVLVGTLAAPVIISGILSYLFRPFVVLLSKYIPRSLSILLLYGVLAGIITLIVNLVGPIIASQFNQLINQIPRYFEQVQSFIMNNQNHPAIQPIMQGNNISMDSIGSQLQNSASTITDSLVSTLVSIGSAVFSFFVILFVIPFVLFYILREGHKLPGFMLKFVDREHRPEVHKILQDMDRALANYIQGQITVSFIVGILSMILFWIIGLDYVLILGIICMLTNLVPFVGPFIGTIPAVIVALFDAPITALFVIIGVIVIQQLESNLISPQVMGRVLQVHPVTVIFVLLFASGMFGLLGLILAIPAYALIKVVVTNLYRIWQVNRRGNKHRREEII